VTYLHYHGNISKTARALNMHRQSLIYRLQKIEQLTKRSLTDPEDRFLLYLAARLVELRDRVEALETDWRRPSGLLPLRGQFLHVLVPVQIPQDHRQHGPPGCDQVAQEFERHGSGGVKV